MPSIQSLGIRVFSGHRDSSDSLKIAQFLAWGGHCALTLSISLCVSVCLSLSLKAPPLASNVPDLFLSVTAEKYPEVPKPAMHLSHQENELNKQILGSRATHRQG